MQKGGHGHENRCNSVLPEEDVDRTWKQSEMDTTLFPLPLKRHVRIFIQIKMI